MTADWWSGLNPMWVSGFLTGAAFVLFWVYVVPWIAHKLADHGRTHGWR